MPFPCKYKIIKNNHTKCKTTYVEKVSLAPLYNASLCVEAAIVLPIFIYAVMSLVCVINIIGLQMRVQESLYNTGMAMAKYEYVYEMVKKEGNINLEELKDSNILSELLSRGMEAGTVKTLVIADLGYDYVEKSYIKGGVSGMHFYLSEFVSEEGRINIIVTYNIKIPFDIFGFGTIPVKQCAKVHSWKGDKSIIKDNSDSDNKEYVYITENGSVYHKDQNCTYLTRKISEINYANIGSIRNKSGGKYYACKKCGKSINKAGSVYYTDYGDCYHSNKNCSELKRGILKVELKAVSDRRPCSKCSTSE